MLKQEGRREEVPQLVSPATLMSSASVSPSGPSHPDTSHHGSGQVVHTGQPLGAEKGRYQVGQNTQNK